ncbi:hypothetical protein SAMN05428989_3967 [Pseudoxanthomonas sp. GM95]|nr:benenodin family lasso peptide [Pseudoxanthomonas sp. GM95]SEM51572.1 hypothetical protein SAMN05428989_3967 [Pseudoxanthomonas sp. GM95]
METNENIRNESEHLIVLGVASVATKGVGLRNEPIGGQPTPGISEE